MRAFAGTIFVVDLLVNFHVGFIVTNNFQRRVVMDAKEVAAYYVRRGAMSNPDGRAHDNTVGLRFANASAGHLGRKLALHAVALCVRLTRVVDALHTCGAQGLFGTTFFQPPLGALRWAFLQ